MPTQIELTGNVGVIDQPNGDKAILVQPDPMTAYLIPLPGDAAANVAGGLQGVQIAREMPPDIVVPPR